MTAAAAPAAPAAPASRARTHPLGRRAFNRAIRETFRQHCRPIPRLTMSQWAARYRVLSREATNQHGRWRNEKVPYLVPIMDALSDRVTQEITVVAPSQSGKTELILNAAGFFMHQEPSPILIVQPTVETGESFSKDRVAPMIRDTDVLTQLVGPARSRSSSNTILSKAFPGGQLDITGANAPSGLAMRPKRVVALDERDRHPRTAGGEGDVKKIASARTRSFGRRRKIIEVSSPTDPETSLIWPSYLEGTQEVVEIPCPACGFFQAPVFERLKWEKNDAGQVIPASVCYECAGCGYRIPASQQGPVKRACRVRQTAEPRVPHKRSFRIHGIAAAFHDWVEIAQEFVTATTQEDPAVRAEQLRAFFNTTLGELYKDQEKETAKSALLARAKAYATGADWQVPREVGILAAGMDLQHDRGELVVRGFGVGEESWLIERAVFRGDTSQPEWWAVFEDYRTRRTWLHESGCRLAIRSLAIDAGDGTHAKTVYNYCAPRLGQGVFAIKGSSNPGAPMTPVKHTKVKPGRLYVIGVNAIMDRLYRRLAMPERGPGFLHMNTFCDDDYATQLLSMRRIIDPKTRKRRWEATPNVRNEVADAEAYAYAALLLGPIPTTQLADEVERVNEEGQRLQRIARGEEEEPGTPTAPAPDPFSPPPAPSRGGWVSRYRRR